MKEQFETLGDMIAYYRAYMLHMTQQQFAEYVGRDVRAVQYWESNEKKPNITSLNKIFRENDSWKDRALNFRQSITTSRLNSIALADTVPNNAESIESVDSEYDSYEEGDSDIWEYDETSPCPEITKRLKVKKPRYYESNRDYRYYITDKRHRLVIGNTLRQIDYVKQLIPLSSCNGFVVIGNPQNYVDVTKKQRNIGCAISYDDLSIVDNKSGEHCVPYNPFAYFQKEDDVTLYVEFLIETVFKKEYYHSETKVLLTLLYKLVFNGFYNYDTCPVKHLNPLTVVELIQTLLNNGAIRRFDCVNNCTNTINSINAVFSELKNTAHRDSVIKEMCLVMEPFICFYKSWEFCAEDVISSVRLYTLFEMPDRVVLLSDQYPTSDFVNTMLLHHIFQIANSSAGGFPVTITGEGLLSLLNCECAHFTACSRPLQVYFEVLTDGVEAVRGKLPNIWEMFLGNITDIVLLNTKSFETTQYCANIIGDKRTLTGYKPLVSFESIAELPHNKCLVISNKNNRQTIVKCSLV